MINNVIPKRCCTFCIIPFRGTEQIVTICVCVEHLSHFLLHFYNFFHFIFLFCANHRCKLQFDMFLFQSYMPISALGASSSEIPRYIKKILYSKEYKKIRSCLTWNSMFFIQTLLYSL